MKHDNKSVDCGFTNGFYKPDKDRCKNEAVKSGKSVTNVQSLPRMHYSQQQKVTAM